MDLSVCIIVKDGKEHIERCLKSVQLFADEIIVVDTGSTDGTPDIVSNMIGRVYFYPWNDNFSDARNFSLKLTTKKWCMWVDADDVVPIDTGIAIRQIVDKAQLNSYYMFDVKNINPADMSMVCEETFRQSRLFPNIRAGHENGIHFEGAIHEQFTQTAFKLGVSPCNHYGLIVEHHGYQDKKTLNEKLKRNIRICMAGIGFPKNTDFYEFDIDDCFCLYAPNTLAIWKGLKMIGVCNPFENGLPETQIERIEQIKDEAKKIIDAFMDSQKTHSQRIDDIIKQLDNISNLAVI